MEANRGEERTFIDMILQEESMLINAGSRTRLGRSLIRPAGGFRMFLLATCKNTRDAFLMAWILILSPSYS